LASNPKLFTIGVGKLEAAKAMKTGFVISLIISVTFHAIDQVLNDQKTWHDLVAGIAVDMAVVGAAIVTTKVFMAAAASTVIAGSALGPLVIVVIVGVAFAFFLPDTKKYIEYIANQLRKSEENMKKNLIQIKNRVQKVENEFIEEPYDFLNRIFGLPSINTKQKMNYHK